MLFRSEDIRVSLIVIVFTACPDGFYGFLFTLGTCRCLDGLVAAEEDWHELVIVRGHPNDFVRGLYLPGEEPKVTPSKLRVSLSYHCLG